MVRKLIKQYFYKKIKTVINHDKAIENQLTILNFENNSDQTIYIWTEPTAYEIEIPPNFEYKLVTDDHEVSFDFNKNKITFYLEKRLGYKLLKRKISTNSDENWDIDIDTLDL